MIKLVLSFILIFLFIDVYPLVIKLKKEVEVCGLYVELGQIGDIEGDNELKSLKLCRVPDKTIKIDSDYLRRMLENIIKSDFIIQGKEVVIKPLRTILLPQEIVEKIKTEAYKTYEFLKPDSVQIVLTSPLSEIRLPQADIQINTIIPKTITNKTKMARIEVLVENQLYKTVLVSFNLIIRTKIVKAVRDIKENEVFSRDMVKIESDFLYFNDNRLPLLPHNYDNFLGKKFVCGVKRDKTVFEDCLK